MFSKQWSRASNSSSLESDMEFRKSDKCAALLVTGKFPLLNNCPSPSPMSAPEISTADRIRELETSFLETLARIREVVPAHIRERIRTVSSPEETPFDSDVHVFLSSDYHVLHHELMNTWSTWNYCRLKLPYNQGRLSDLPDGTFVLFVNGRFVYDSEGSYAIRTWDTQDQACDFLWSSPTISWPCMNSIQQAGWIPPPGHMYIGWRIDRHSVGSEKRFSRILANARKVLPAHDSVTGDSPFDVPFSWSANEFLRRHHPKLLKALMDTWESWNYEQHMASSVRDQLPTTLTNDDIVACVNGNLSKDHDGVVQSWKSYQEARDSVKAQFEALGPYVVNLGTATPCFFH